MPLLIHPGAQCTRVLGLPFLAPVAAPVSREFPSDGTGLIMSALELAGSRKTKLNIGCDATVSKVLGIEVHNDIRAGG